MMTLKAPNIVTDRIHKMYNAALAFKIMKN